MKEIIGIFMLLYLILFVGTLVFGLMVGIEIVDSKVVDEIADNPYKINTPLKILLFIVFHGVYMLFIMHKVCEDMDDVIDKKVKPTNWFKKLVYLSHKFWNYELWK